MYILYTYVELNVLGKPAYFIIHQNNYNFMDELTY